MELSELYEQSEEALESGDLAASKKAARRLLARLASTPGATSTDLATVEKLLARIALAEDNLDICRDHLLTALKLMKSYKGKSQDSRLLQVQILTELGTVYRLQSDYKKAGPTLRKALETADRYLPDSDLATAMTLNQIGILCKYTANFKEGLQHYKRALQIIRKQLGRDHILASTLLHNIGGIEHAAGHAKQAEKPAREAVAIRASQCSANDPSLAEDLSALAAILCDLEQFQEAKTIYSKVLRTYTKIFGEDAYEVAVSLGNIGSLYHAQAKYKQAEKYFLQALPIEQKVLGSKHVEVGMTLNNLAVIYTETGRHQEALSFYTQAMGIYEKQLPKNHPTRLLCLDNQTRSKERLKKSG